MEEWRAPLIDAMVLSLVQHHEVRPEHFLPRDAETGGIYMTREGRNIFLRAYEKKLCTTNKYFEGKHSFRYLLAQQAKDIIDPETDSLRVYFLAHHTAVRTWGVGDKHVEEVILF